MLPYAPLNVRSHYSFHDSLLPIRTIIARAAELGLPAVGLADPNLHGAVEFFLAARAMMVRIGRRESWKL